MTDNFDDMKNALKERLIAFGKYRHTVIPRQNRFRFLMAAAAASVIGLLVLPKQNIEAAPHQEIASVAIPGLDLTRHDIGLDKGFASKSIIKTVKLEPGDNLGPLLQRNGLSGTEAYRVTQAFGCLLYTSPSPRDQRGSRMPSSA